MFCKYFRRNGCEMDYFKKKYVYISSNPSILVIALVCRQTATGTLTDSTVFAHTTPIVGLLSVCSLPLFPGTFYLENM
jgi:hypothetical protein